MLAFNNVDGNGSNYCRNQHRNQRDCRDAPASLPRMHEECAQCNDDDANTPARHASFRLIRHEIY